MFAVSEMFPVLVMFAMFLSQPMTLQVLFEMFVVSEMFPMLAMSVMFPAQPMALQRWWARLIP